MVVLMPMSLAMPHKEDCQCPVCRSKRGERKKRHPVFAVRLKPELQAWIRTRPEGATAWLEALVTDAMAREEADGQGEGRQL